MKTKTYQTILFLLIFFIFALSLVAANQIGDKIAKYKAYSGLQAVLKLSHPIHASINELQKERTQSSILISQKDETSLQLANTQFASTDKHLNKFSNQLSSMLSGVQEKRFSEQLNLRQTLFFAIPQKDFIRVHDLIKEHRQELLDKKIEYDLNFDFYTDAISDFIEFLDKIYKISREEEFTPLISGLMNLESYKEMISQEQTYVSYQLTQNQITPGEVPLIRQLLADQIFYKQRLYLAEDEQLNERLKILDESPEYDKLQEVRMQFQKENFNLAGSQQRGAEYFNTAQKYLEQIQKLNLDILFGIDALATDGKASVKKDIIVTIIISLVVILLLVGIYVFIRKKAAL